jgi:hypothetical protein
LEYFGAGRRIKKVSRGSAVGIATGYGIEHQGVGV